MDEYAIHWSRSGIQPGSQSNLILGISITVWALAVLTVSLRLYSRIRYQHYKGTDDWWMLAAVFFSTADETTKIIWSLNGLGDHIQTLSVQELNIALKATFAIQIIYPVSLGCVKISILMFYLRLFPYEGFRKLCWFMISVITAITLAFSLTMLFACRPIQYGWALDSAGHCIRKDIVQYTGSVINLATDLIVLLLPIKHIWSMHLTVKGKLGIIGLFSLGSLTCIVSAVRISTIAVFYRSKDPTWTGSNIAICSAVEINLAIMTASIPACKPVLSRFLARILPSNVWSTYHSNDDSKGSQGDWSQPTFDNPDVEGQHNDKHRGANSRQHSHAHSTRHNLQAMELNEVEP